MSNWHGVGRGKGKRVKEKLESGRKILQAIAVVCYVRE